MLAYWGTLVWFATAALFWQVALLPAHRQAVADWLAGVADWLRTVGPIAGLLLVAGLVSHVMVHLLEVHDHVYDRYVIKWRDRYAREQMIPELLKPVLRTLPDGLHRAAIENPRRTLEVLFYPFASDRDTKIGRNLIVRFYERVTKYWLTQVVEVAVILLTLATAVYVWSCHAWAQPSRLVGLVVALAVVFALNRLLAAAARHSVWDATRAEIDAIHSSLRPQFEKAVSELTVDYVLKIDPKSTSA